MQLWKFKSQWISCGFFRELDDSKKSLNCFIFLPHFIFRSTLSKENFIWFLFSLSCFLCVFFLEAFLGKFFFVFDENLLFFFDYFLYDFFLHFLQFFLSPSKKKSKTRNGDEEEDRYEKNYSKLFYITHAIIISCQIFSITRKFPFFIYIFFDAMLLLLFKKSNITYRFFSIFFVFFHCLTATEFIHPHRFFFLYIFKKFMQWKLSKILIAIIQFNDDDDYDYDDVDDHYYCYY